MKLKRLWWTVRLFFTPGGGTVRAAYAKKAGIYAGVGANVAISPRVVPLYSELIRFHDNIRVAKGVDFVTHDTMHTCFNRIPEEEKPQGNYSFKERIGCIEVMDNVFIGSHSIILYNTKIGPNVIIASGSVVTKDCEPNSVYAGVPARRIGSFEDFVRKRMKQEQTGEIATTMHNQALLPEEIQNAWDIFEKSIHNSCVKG